MAAVGVDVGGTKCLGVALDDAGAVVGEHRVETPATAPALLDAVVAVVEALDRTADVGVGVPGLVDNTGTLRFAPNLPGASSVPIADELAARLGRRPVVDNDANCAAWGERQRGAGWGSDEMVLVTLGTGIGGGIVTGGRLLRGAHGFAGEVGHMVVDVGGVPCPCGQRGCWERYASGSGLGRLARDAATAGRATRVVALAGGDPETVRGEHVTTAAADGDDEALTLMAELGWWVGLGLATLANVFDPERFVLAGGLVEAGAVLLDPVRTAFADLVEGGHARPEVPIVAAELGEQAGAVGAALLASQKNSGQGRED